MMDWIKRYLFGLQEDAGKWEKTRVILTFLVVIILLTMTFSILQFRGEFNEFKSYTEELSFYCEYMYPGLSDPENNTFPTLDYLRSLNKSLNISIPT